MASANNIAFTAPINAPGASNPLSRNQVWVGLLLKIRSAETFVPQAIQKTEVLSETTDPSSGNAVTVREVTFRENQKKVKETVTAFEKCRVEFEQPDGSKVSNIVSDGVDGLYMTYVFEWRHPGVSKDDLAVFMEKETRMARTAVEGTIKVLRELNEEDRL